MSKLNSKWFMGLDQDEKAEFEQLVRNSRTLLNQLTKIVEKEIDELANPGPADYDCPAWAYKQADRNGEIRALRKILKLTDL